ncbi:MAG TPA: alpha/beta fold hydrolase [Longimicrobium sp.]|jgi:dienelactone hydrolase|nr:alpha/beta fold hydrolase [Longimicrobium sp.]
MRSRSFSGALLAAALLMPAAARAQERGAFVVTVGADTILVERFTRTAGMVEAVADLTGRARMAIVIHTGAGASVSEVDLRAWGPGAPDGAAPLQRGRVVFAGDSTVATLEAGGQPHVQTVRGTRGALPMLNPSALMLEQVLMRARALSPRDSVTVPMLLIGSTQAFAARVRWVGADSAVLSDGMADVRARVDPAGRLLGAAVPSQNLVILRVADARAPTSARADYSAPEGAPYAAEEVRVPHPGGFQLAGTLTLPGARRGRVPAVVTITGTGQEDRDESIPNPAGYRPFREVADTLGRRGIAVLRMDDRGFGASGGDPSRATSRDFAGDIAAAVAYLRTRPEIDPGRIALVGHSEGGIIAPMLATDDPRIRAVVLIAGTSRKGRRVLDYQLRQGVDLDTTIAPARRDSAYRAAWATMDSTAARMPWLTFFYDYDPLVTAAKLRQPVLILQGATDRQVTADQAPELAAAIRGGGNRDVTLRVFPGLDHLMAPDPDGSPAGYATLPSPKVSREVLGTLADWLTMKLR